ncbi:transposase [Streptomyces zhihengii]|uniref:transposase n=1 Tax=Streptomyces zhihengii TaxID=1818004 RepID=UPI0033A49BAC
MPKPYPEEFRQDVVRVARNRGAAVTVEQVATDFGVHPMTLWKWMRRADIDEGAKPGTSSQEGVELREARRRIKLLEQENEVLRRAAAYLSQAPARPGRRPPRDGTAPRPTGAHRRARGHGPRGRRPPLLLGDDAWPDWRVGVLRDGSREGDLLGLRPLPVCGAAAERSQCRLMGCPSRGHRCRALQSDAGRAGRR